MKTSVLVSLFSLLLLVSCGQKKATPAEAPAPAEAAPSTQAETDYQPSLTKGSAAPDFQVNDTLGHPIRLSAYRGKFVVMEFWASWCGDCRRETPKVLDLWRQFNPDGVEFFGVSFDHDEAAWRQYLSQNPLPFAQGSNLIKWKENPINEAYGLHWIPTFFLIGPSGNVIDVALTAEDLVPELVRVTTAGPR